MMQKFLFALSLVCSLALARADVYIINGERIEGEVHDINGQLTICTDELCMIIPPDAQKVSSTTPAESVRPSVAADAVKAVETAAPASCRLAQGYLSTADFLSWLKGNDEPASQWLSTDRGLGGFLLGLLLILFGGLAMNLTPCVLPMVPINLMIIGKSAARGALYGLGIAFAYGIMGVLAAIGGMAFGEIQGNPWFNVVIALIFLALGLSMLGVFFIDFSKRRGGFAQKKATMLPGLFAFFMGMVSAVLAGACVAPILIAVLLLTAKLHAEGHVLALALPFVLGLGMGLPWPFAGAGLQVLPKPGGWMKYVNRAFGVLVLSFAAWYGYLAYTGFVSTPADLGGEASGRIAATPETFASVMSDQKKPVFVDCWATWCKNCTMMEKTTFVDPEVVSELKRYTVIRLQAEDISELRKLPGFEAVKGLPAFAIFD